MGIRHAVLALALILAGCADKSADPRGLRLLRIPGGSAEPAGLLKMMGPTDGAKLSKAIDATASKPGSIKSANTSGTLDGFSSRRITISSASVPGTRQSGTLNQLLVLASGQTYVVQTIVLNDGSSESQQDVADAARFIDSFERIAK